MVTLIQWELRVLTLDQGFVIMKTPVLLAAGLLSSTDLFQANAQAQFCSFTLQHIVSNLQRCYD